MEIYTLEGEPKFCSVDFADEEQRLTVIHRMPNAGVSSMPLLIRMKVTGPGRNRIAVDCPYVSGFGGVVLLSDYGYTALEDLIQKNGFAVRAVVEDINGEQLNQTYVLFFVSLVKDLLDSVNSTGDRTPSGDLTTIHKYHFSKQPQIEERIFLEKSRGWLVFVTDDFASRVKERSLTGFNLVKIWSDTNGGVDLPHLGSDIETMLAYGRFGKQKAAEFPARRRSTQAILSRRAKIANGDIHYLRETSYLVNAIETEQNEEDERLRAAFTISATAKDLARWCFGEAIRIGYCPDPIYLAIVVHSEGIGPVAEAARVLDYTRDRDNGLLGQAAGNKADRHQSYVDSFKRVGGRIADIVPVVEEAFALDAYEKSIGLDLTETLRPWHADFASYVERFAAGDSKALWADLDARYGAVSNRTPGTYGVELAVMEYCREHLDAFAPVVAAMVAENPNSILLSN